MPKTVLARSALANAGLPFIAWLGNPTTGGVYASFASLADVVWAEPGATIGFAGPRVAERMTGQPLPEGSHTAEFALRHGLIDDVVAFGDLAQRAIDALSVLAASGEVMHAQHLTSWRPQPPGDVWAEVVAARDPARPTAAAIARGIARHLTELRGDRAGAEDPGVMTAVGRIPMHDAGTARGVGIALIALDRTHPTPAGYRKARRLMSIAGKLRLPLVTFVDTPGADPSAPSEASGIAGEIARTFAAILTYPAPVVSVVTGEGGSGGALALAVANRLLICEHAIFSVIAPEAAAAILKRDDVAEVAGLQHLTAYDLVRLKIADAAIRDDMLSIAILSALSSVDKSDPAGERQQRWRRAAIPFLVDNPAP
jgi:acetyl-CoA carboxylase carboxyl transferase subunit beta